MTMRSVIMGYVIVLIFHHISLLRKSSRLFIMCSISAGIGSSGSMCRPVGMWCNAAVTVGRERWLRHGLVVVFLCNLLRIGRWSELSIDNVCQEHELMRDSDANDTSGNLGSAFGGTLVGGIQAEDCIVGSRIRVLGVVRRCAIEDLYPLL